MSVNVDLQVAGPGNPSYLEEAWELKEYIRRKESVLKQQRRFFMDAYRRATVHILFIEDRLIGFAATRRDGYILFLAIHPEYRGKGYGKKLIDRIADEHQSVSCHARTTNRNALEFYERLGFDIVRRVDNYYEDNGDAFYLRRGEGTSFGSKLSNFLRR